MKRTFYTRMKEAIFGKPLMSDRIKRYIAQDPNNAHKLIDQVSKSTDNEIEIVLDGKLERLTIV